MGYALDIGAGIPRALWRPGRAARARLVCVVLLAFGLRALIPVGFMPAADGSLSLMICPAGFPAALLPGHEASQGMGPSMPMHQHRGLGLADSGYCAFTTGFSSAPPPPLLAALLLLLACVALISVTVPAPADIRLVHVPQARAPPRAI